MTPKWTNALYDSPDHDAVLVVIRNQTKCVGLTTFLQEIRIEYFVEEFPSCCSFENLGANLSTRAAFAALNHWGEYLTLAENLDLLGKNPL